MGTWRSENPGGAHVGASPIRRDDTPTHPLTWLQRRAGNVAVVALLAPAKPSPPSLQRARVDLPSGGGVGDAPATNHREGVLLVLDRMHVLWGIDNTEYNSIYPSISALAPGAPVTNPVQLALLQRSLDRTLAPMLPSEVAAAQYGISLGSSVGRRAAECPGRCAQGAGPVALPMAPDQ